jgi:hypothetical protein
MKRIAWLAAAAFGGIVLATGAIAETVTEKTTTTETSSSGLVSELGPDTIVIRSESSPAPVPYTYSKTTTYVDEAGNPVSMETVRSGAPVTVYYTKTADGMAASRIIVKKTTTTSPSGATVEEKKTTTITP